MFIEYLSNILIRICTRSKISMNDHYVIDQIFFFKLTVANKELIPLNVSYLSLNQCRLVNSSLNFTKIYPA